MRAQAAKGVAAAIRSFQPAIREFTEASSDLRSTISTEMGLDALTRDFQDLRRSTSQVTNWRAPLMAPPPPLAPQQPSVNGAHGADGVREGAGASAGSALAEAPAGLSEEERRAVSGAAASLAASDGDVQRRGGNADVGGEDHDIDRKRAESAAMAWGGQVPSHLSASDGQLGQGARSQLKRLDDMTIAELEAELRRRRALVDQINALEG
jgi:hypothetical protein